MQELAKLAEEEGDWTIGKALTTAPAVSRAARKELERIEVSEECGKVFEDYGGDCCDNWEGTEESVVCRFVLISTFHFTCDYDFQK